MFVITCARATARLWGDERRSTLGIPSCQRTISENNYCVELVGFEPTTSCLQSRCSGQLSYSPNRPVGLGGVEPPTSRLSGVRSNRLSYKPIAAATVGNDQNIAGGRIAASSP